MKNMNTNHRTTTKSCLQRYLLPSITGRGLGVGLLLLASLVLGACSSDSDSSNGNEPKNTGYTETIVSEAPVWAIDWTNNQERPNWAEPAQGSYENSTILKVQIEETLKPFASDGDLLAIFINGELRGMAAPAQTLSGQAESGKFLLKAWGNESGTETVNMSLSYYSQTLKHIFTLSGDINLNSDETTGIDEAFIPAFTYGSAKYPVVMPLNAAAILAKADIKPVAGDCFAAFVGDECRGICASPADGLSLTVYGRQAGESITVKYYQAATSKLFTFADAAKTKR